MKDSFVYILRCSDASYYTGVTNNLDRRLEEHNSGLIKGYTSSRIPVKLVFSERFSDINDAIRLEKQLRGWSRKKKEALIKGDFYSLVELSKKKSKQDSLLY